MCIEEVKPRWAGVYVAYYGDGKDWTAYILFESPTIVVARGSYFFYTLGPITSQFHQDWKEENSTMF